MIVQVGKIYRCQDQFYVCCVIGYHSDPIEDVIGMMEINSCRCPVKYAIRRVIDVDNKYEIDTTSRVYKIVLCKRIEICPMVFEVPVDEKSSFPAENKNDPKIVDSFQFLDI